MIDRDLGAHAVVLSLAITAFQVAIGTAHGQSCPTPSNSSIFNVSLCVEEEVQNYNGNSVMSLIDQFDEDALRARFEGYDEETSAAQFRVDLRGLPVALTFEQNSNVLRFNVPSLGIDRTFAGATRDDSVDAFEEYIKQDGEEILRELLRVSSIDPLAGNPASVQSAMVESAFTAGTDPRIDSLDKGSSFGVGARFGRYGNDRFTQNVYTLPLSYVYTFSNYDRLIVDVPLSYIEAEGSSSYRMQVNLSYKKNITSRWALSPSIGWGAAGSADIASAGHILSAALTSDLMLYDQGKWAVSMGNMVGYYASQPIKFDDYSVDYDLKNTIIRNGLLFTMPWQVNIAGKAFSLDAFVTDTRFFGDALYSDNYQEIGISFGPRRNVNKLAPNTSSHPIGIGLKYVRGDGDIDGAELTFGYAF